MPHALRRKTHVTDDANDPTKPTQSAARPAGAATDDLARDIAAVSAAAFAMAQVATERKDFAAHQADVRALVIRLAQLRIRIDELPTDEQRQFEVAWTDAQLDLEYLRAAGDPPLFSLRMHRFLHPDQTSE